MPTTAPTASGGGNTNTYLDDRSTPQELMRSFVNSINHHEYVRTYSYWEQGAAQLPPFPQFEQGYANTQSVQLTIGTVHSDSGAGQVYYPVPVTIVSQLTNNTTETFVGCYTLHQSQPGIFGTPPFRGLAIQSAQAQQVANNANTAALMANACPPANGLPTVADVPSPQTDISGSHYIDDRSDGVLVLRSLFNALNRKEYVRAYSYWEPSSPQLQPFNQFQQGYANTASVQLTTGTETTDAGAGQFYYNVPVVLVSKTTGNATQTFTGCYTLHLANPGIQGQPPFQPLAIRSGTINPVPNSPTPAMPTCQP
jgi:hypothetical protein